MKWTIVIFALFMSLACTAIATGKEHRTDVARQSATIIAVGMACMAVAAAVLIT